MVVVGAFNINDGLIIYVSYRDLNSYENSGTCLVAGQLSLLDYYRFRTVADTHERSRRPGRSGTDYGYIVGIH
jgi:hypothetical protein